LAGQWIGELTQDEWSTFYLGTDQDKIWPVANDDRRFGAFWLSNQGPLVAPMYARIVTSTSIAAGPENWLYCYFVLEPQDDGTAFADSGLNELGRRLTVTLRNWDEPHPVYNEIGVSWDFVYSRVGFADDVNFGVFNMPNTTQHEFTPFWYDWPFNRGVDLALRTARPYSSWEDGQDTDWNPFQPIRRALGFHCIPWGRAVPNNPGLSPYPPNPEAQGSPKARRRKTLRKVVGRSHIG